MNRKWVLLTGLSVIVVLLAILMTLTIGTYRLTRFQYFVDDLGPAHDSLSSCFINERGDVAWTTEISSANPWISYGFVRDSSGSMTFLHGQHGKRYFISDLNDLGVVAGYSYIPPSTAESPVYEGFIWTATDGITAASKIVGCSMVVIGLNNNGQMVGFSGATDSLERTAMCWSEDTGCFSLGSLGYGHATAHDINDSGLVWGVADVIDGKQHAFVWNATHGMIDIATPSALSTVHVAMNDAGQILYVEGRERERAAYLWSSADGRMPLRKPSNLGSWAQGIGNTGAVVGFVGIQRKPSILDRIGDLLLRRGRSRTHTEAHACLWENGRILDLNDYIQPESGWVLHQAFDINDSGQIVGEGRFGGDRRVFLLTPKP